MARVMRVVTLLDINRASPWGICKLSVLSMEVPSGGFLGFFSLSFSLCFIGVLIGMHLPVPYSPAT